MKVPILILSLLGAFAVAAPTTETTADYDYVIIGSGPGGGSLASVDPFRFAL